MLFDTLIVSDLDILYRQISTLIIIKYDPTPVYWKVNAKLCHLERDYPSGPTQDIIA